MLTLTYNTILLDKISRAEIKKVVEETIPGAKITWIAHEDSLIQPLVLEMPTAAPLHIFNVGAMVGGLIANRSKQQLKEEAGIHEQG